MLQNDSQPNKLMREPYAPNSPIYWPDPWRYQDELGYIDIDAVIVYLLDIRLLTGYYHRHWLGGRGMPCH